MHFLASYSGIAAAILRITLGVFLLAHGVPKLLGIAGFVGMLGNMFPAPLNWVVGLLTIIIEVGGGALLIVGFQTRIAAFASFVLFLGIAFVMHFKELFLIFDISSGSSGQAKFEFPFLIAIASLMIATFGKGKAGISD